MKFILHRDPSNKLQKIPLLAMQLSGLVDAQELIVHVDEGCILLSRDGLSAREAMKTNHPPQRGGPVPEPPAGAGQ